MFADFVMLVFFFFFCFCVPYRNELNVLIQYERSPQVGINVKSQSHTKASVNKPQIETVLWGCAVSFTEQGRSLIAGQDPLRVLKEVCFVGIFSLVSSCPLSLLRLSPMRKRLTR
jgi:hypothetical protein